MGGIFKAYDIRGIYGEQLTDAITTDIGRAFAAFTKAGKVVVGRDMRPHSTPLFAALTKGLTAQGADVIDLGMASTPMCYYATGSLAADAGIMITASHNPGEWNGLKMCRAGAVPISGATGIKDIEAMVVNRRFEAPAAVPGKVTHVNILPDYQAHVARRAHVSRPVRVAVDMANAMGIYEAKAIESLLTIDAIYDTLDGTFPNHEANPLKLETLEALQAKVRAGGYDFGAAFDGDADRVGFVDERGEAVPMDMITALIAQDILAAEKGVIFYDLRSSWAVKEVIEANGGKPMMSRVGHAFIKQQMRDHNAIFAGEVSGHFYFRDNYTTESSAMAVLCVANIVAKANQPLSALIRPIQRYFASGEINSEVDDTAKVLAKLKKKYAKGRMFELDGVSVEFDDWWFNVRSSNTEPLIRLNMEARTRERMEQKRDELLAIIRG